MPVAGRRSAAKMMRMVRARVCDPTGPRWLRLVTPAVAAMLIVFSPIAPLVAGLRATGLLVGAALFFARRVFRLRFRARDANVHVCPGSIQIVNAGLLDQPVRAADILAASTARTTDGVALAIVRRGSTERPLVLDFASEADLDAVRRPLGLGHFGFGEVAWPTRVRSAALQGSTLLAAAWLAIAVCAAADLALAGLTLALVVIPITVVALLVACVEEPHGPRIALTSAGIRFTEMPAWIPPIRYAEVCDASVGDDGVLLTTSTGPVMVPMGKSLREEREHLAAQVRSAAARARGEGPPPPALATPLTRLAPRREARESERAWLERVDVAAASIATAASGDAYRGSGLDPRDLWAALESPDVPVRIRAAAARVLARVAPEEAKTRVAHVLACDRDVDACATIRGALEDDIETAARELESLGLASRNR
ncbi:MAG TPA: hypothetical protein VII82_04155 [Polyangiaceae bacterium]